MSEDDEGFFFPVINKSECINCHLCEKVCPVSEPKYNNKDNPRVYASYIKDEKERSKSSSGGLFFSIAKWVIEQNGIVYGAAFDDKLKLRHIGVDSLNELSKLRGSKYLQSNMGDVYSEISEYLEKGRLCYFVGTGCQVAGLKKILRKDYPNLITSDLVCHGVPSQKLFDLHLAYLRKKYKNTKIVGYQFRDNANWGVCEIVDFANTDGVIKTYKLPSYELSPYLYSFMYAYTYRYSCYECRFSTIPRQGDITLADFWGIKHFIPEIDVSNGCSLVLINSEKGEKIWSELRNDYVCYESNVEAGAKFNKNLIAQTEKNIIRGEIYKFIDRDGYESVAKTFFRSPNYNKYLIAMYLSNINFIYKPIKALYKRFCKK